MIAIAPRHDVRVLYLSGTLPARSETFVYREVLGLRKRGWRIATASVHPPERNLGDPALEDMADEAVPVYGAGGARLLKDAFFEFFAHPLRTSRTMVRCLLDTTGARDVRWIRKPKLLVQCAAAVALARRTRALNISHIHAHMAHVPTTIAMYASQQLGIGFSFTGHAVDLFRDRSLLEVKVQRARFIACISCWHREFFERLDGGSRPRLPLVRCGVDVNSFVPRANVRQDRRLETDGDEAVAGAGEPTPTILAVGRLVPKKGFDLLLRAIAEPGGGLRDCECIIVGDGPERQRLERMREDLGLHEVVEFTGAKSNDEIRDMMQRADVFVLPCRVDSDGDRDGIPVVLMEAMASGLPVISGDLPAIRELVDHERNGLLVNPERDRALAHSLRQLVNDAERRTRLSRAGRRRIKAEFSLEINLERLESAFDAALGRHREGIEQNEALRDSSSPMLCQAPSSPGKAIQ